MIADLEALEKELDDGSKLREESTSIKKRYEDIFDRMYYIMGKNGGGNTKPSDIITLNIRGTEMFVRRDTITIVKGSRLEVLLSGRWEDQILRDERGRVFMDLNPIVFRMVLEYLYMCKLSAEDGVNPVLPNVEQDMKVMFDLYISFLLERNSSVNDASEVLNEKNVEQSSAHTKKEWVASIKTKLDNLEQKLGVEEIFIKYFTKGGNQDGIDLKYDGSSSTNDSCDFRHSYTKASTSTTGSSDASSIVYTKTSTPTDTDTTNNNEACGILDLYLNGEMIAIRRCTLCIDPASKLAQDFTNDKWLREHRIVTEDGRAAFLMEQPASVFKALVDQLHLRSMISYGDRLVEKSIGEKVQNHYFKRMLAFYFPENETFIDFQKSSMDTVIVEDLVDQIKIKKWLASVNKKSDPKLLYRASRDGWTAKAFHDKCDDKGATIVVVKSEDEYVFGGYSDVAWSSAGGYKLSNKSFLFSLKCYAGLPAVTMRLKNENSVYALFHDPSYGPIFGSGHDLVLASDTNTTDSISYTNISYSNIDITYHLPDGTVCPYFLTGSRNFGVAEYEVFLV